VAESGIDQRILERFASENGFALEGHLVVLGLMGSHSHGTYLPPEEPDAVDDIDLMGFVIPPVEYHLGLPRWQHWTMQYEELDVVLYSLDKAVRLLLKSNPNIVGLLWLRDEEYVYRHPVFDQLLASREIFSSLAAADAFSGYAYDQLKRMEAFDLARMEEYESLTATIRERGPVREVLEADSSKLKHIAVNWGLDHDLLKRFRRLHKSHFSGYMGEKRKAMVRKYQYDVKNASHLVRLLRMGTEYLETGRLQVYREEDAEELMTIKRGGWTLEEVKAEAERLFQRIGDAKARSPLPPEPDQEAAATLLVSMHRTMLAL
jgi:predicted nucleotidyltransferase